VSHTVTQETYHVVGIASGLLTFIGAVISQTAVLTTKWNI